MSEEALINSSLSEGVYTITLNRPDRMNAVTLEMCDTLKTLFDKCQTNDDIRVVQVRGAGRAFCAGRDLSDSTEGEDATEILQDYINPAIKALYDCDKPTIGLVNGAAMGVGFGLALACDIVIGSEMAKFSSPFSKLGAALDCGGHYFLPRRVGTGRALHMIYTATIIGGEKAAHMGLIDQLVMHEVLWEAGDQLATQISNGPLDALRAQKQLLRSSMVSDFESVLAEEAKLQGALAKTAEYAEGMAAFKEKREPDFMSVQKG